MFDFDERDLVRLAEADDFFPIRLSLEAVIEPTPPRAWDAFLNFAANPNVPTAAEAIEEALTPSERGGAPRYRAAGRFAGALQPRSELNSRPDG